MVKKKTNNQNIYRKISAILFLCLLCYLFIYYMSINILFIYINNKAKNEMMKQNEYNKNI